VRQVATEAWRVEVLLEVKGEDGTPIHGAEAYLAADAERLSTSPLYREQVRMQDVYGSSFSKTDAAGRARLSQVLLACQDLREGGVPMVPYSALYIMRDGYAPLLVSVGGVGQLRDDGIIIIDLGDLVLLSRE
jgi:hypothetical protein